MSIIEKAVDKLGKKSDVGQAEKTAPSSSIANAMSASAPVASVAVAREASREATPTTIAVASKVLQAKTEANRTRAASVDRPVVDLPMEQLHEQGIVVPTVPRSAVAESFRQIKRPLVNNLGRDSASPVDGANLIMVTSALQGEGKTYTSISLAMSLAMEQDKRVLFVDADVAKATAGSLLGVPEGSPGLIDVLEDPNVGLADAILRTSMEKLSILPAGSLHERCNELLASDSMRDMMLELSRRYPDRIMVFDSPPVLLTSEAGVLANLMGQIVFVVQADRTPQDLVTEALERIGEDKMVGMVLNKARARRLNRLSYGYNYGYSYGSKSRYPSEAPDAAAGI